MTKSSESLPKKIILCTPVWGIDYLETFTQLCIKSLLGEYNIPHLSKLICLEYIIYTDEKGKEYLFNNESFINLKKYIFIEFKIIVINSKKNKFDIFNDCYADAIRQASYSKSAVLFVNADLMISDKFMDMIYNKILDGKRCVEIDGFRVIKENMLEIFRDSKQNINVSGDELARIAISNMHPMMRGHFWKLCHEYGYSPYHTYWKCRGSKEAGLVGRSAHIGPIYIFPRSYFYTFERTIDWDLVDNSGIDWHEIYHLLDSKYSFCVEVSDINYLSMPAYHHGANIFKERYFINKNYNRFNVKNLNLEIFIRGNESTASFYMAKLQSVIWYFAAVRNSNLSAILDIVLSLSFCLINYLISSIGVIFDLIVYCRENKNKQIFEIITCIDTKQYNEKILNELSKQINIKIILNLLFNKKRFISQLNHENEKIFFNNKSGYSIKSTSDNFTIYMYKDYFYGSMWEIFKNYPLVSTSKYGESSVYLELSDKYSYELEIVICSINPKILYNLNVILNDKFSMMYRVNQTDKYVLVFHIPQYLAQLRDGKVKITIQNFDRMGFISCRALVQAINVRSINLIQEQILKMKGLSADFYLHYCALSSQYCEVYNSCLPETSLNSDLAVDWLKKIEKIIYSESFKLVSLFAYSNSINLTEYFVGLGWGDSVNLARGKYRYLSNDNNATIFTNARVGKKNINFRLYFHDFDDSILQFSISINEINIDNCEILYENGKYFVRGSYTSAVFEPDKLMFLKFKIEYINKNKILNKIAIKQRLKILIRNHVYRNNLNDPKRLAFNLLEIY